MTAVVLLSTATSNPPTRHSTVWFQCDFVQSLVRVLQITNLLSNTAMLMVSSSASGAMRIVGKMSAASVSKTEMTALVLSNRR